MVGKKQDLKNLVHILKQRGVRDRRVLIWLFLVVMTPCSCGNRFITCELQLSAKAVPRDGGWRGPTRRMVLNRELYN